MYAVQHGAGEGRSYLMEHNAILDSKLSLSSNIPLYAQPVSYTHLTLPTILRV